MHLDTIPSHYTDVILNMKDLYFVDLDGVDALSKIVYMLRNKGKRVFVTAIRPVIQNIFVNNKLFKDLTDAHKIYDDVNSALIFIEKHANLKEPGN